MTSMLRILHLEDDPHDAELIQALLDREELNCEMVQVDTQEDFLAALDRESFDLILADYRLPSFDGLTALSLVQERCPKVPFILVSGTLGEELAIDSLKAGATDYVLKQRLSRLVPAMRRALREAEEHEKRKQAEQTTKRLLDQQIVINQLALSLGEFRTLDQVYRILYEQIHGLMDTDAFIISSFDEETQLIHAGYVITQGTVRDVAHFPPIPLEKEGQGTQSQVIRTGELLYFPDWRQAMDHTQTEHMIDEDGTVSDGPPPPDEREESTNTALLVPMKKAGKTIGVMQVQSHRLNGYTREDIDLLSGLANVAAVAIENVALFEEVQHELTERRRVEEEQQQLHWGLIQAERMATVGTVAAGIVHNLRGPLTSILGYGQLLQRKQPDSSDLEQIVSSAQQMNQMIEDVLTKSRPERSREPTNLNALLQHELDFLQANPVFKHEVEKDIRLAEDLPSIEGVYTDLSQVFGNLLRNAVDAMHQRDTKRLTVVTSFTEKHIIVEVIDTGCGIPEANIPRLFTPFFTTKPSGVEEGEPGGTGIGLYTVQRLLEPYGADIEVKSVVDAGTTFWVKIPV